VGVKSDPVGCPAGRAAPDRPVRCTLWRTGACTPAPWPVSRRALKALSNAGLIARQVRSLDDVGNAEASFYVPTTPGKALIAALYRGLLPSREDGPARTHCQESPFSTGRITASAPGEAEVHVR